MCRKITSISLIILAIFIGCSGMIIIKYKKNVENQKNARKYTEKLIILPDKDFNPEIVENIRARIERIPSKILKELYNEGVRIQLINGSITDLPLLKEYNGQKFDDFNGIYYPGTAVIRIDNNYKYAIELHEIGHAIDASLLKISTTEEFLNIFSKEAHAIFQSPNETYYSSSPQEYFAQTFCMYYYDSYNRKKLKRSAPETYKILQKSLN